jgi:hypothetical protein
MHRIFQKDLFVMRFNAARTYHKTLTAAIGPTASASEVQLKLSTEVSSSKDMFQQRLNYWSLRSLE